MTEPNHTDAWVFHAGALGDFVLIWPLLRTLARTHRQVHIVADASKAALAASSIGANLVPHDVQRREFTHLWARDPGPGFAPIRNASLVVNFVAEPVANPRWSAAARIVFPHAELLYVGPPASQSRALLWRAMEVEQWGGVPVPSTPATAAVTPCTPVLCHVGAGSPAKRWPMASWNTLAKILPRRAVFIAGEVEAEQFTEAEHALFRSLDGRLCATLQELAETIRHADVFVGADSGPTHLAAQLGLSTLALFGPTDPTIWAPVGPRVRVVAPTHAASITWLTPERVRDEIALRL